MKNDQNLQTQGGERFFSNGSKAGIQAAQASKLGRLLTALNRAKSPDDMDQPGWRLHDLEGKRRACWSVQVNGDWRLTFEFDGEDAILVDYEDYR
ncbi:type II toxin-antitoxin system RelE/ParE family toxin [Paraburkholderia xenovorans]|uniref:type II toxin-antitoxin system RelE/ParE family toxin n=1 Tax=Paraburkholderia xenovorans TaxID=36873 RepID=UPI0038BCC55E